MASSLFVAASRWVRASVLLAILFGASAARSEPSKGLRLLYSRSRGASESTASCPDEQALRESVAARLGYEPFSDDAEGVVVATLRGGPHGLRAIIELRDRKGRVTGSRLLTTASNDCQELAAAMALAICIAVDPFVLSRPPSPPPPPPPSSSPPQAVPVPPPCAACPSCPPATASPVRFRVGAGLQIDVGAVPTIGSLGVVMQAELRYRAFALAIEGRVDPNLGAARAGSTESGGVGVSLLLGLIAPCARYRYAGFCALLALGAMQGRGVELAVSMQATTFYAAAGARLAFEIPLARRLALELRLDGLTPLTRTSLLVDGAAAWTTPPIAGALAAILQVPFS